MLKISKKSLTQEFICEHNIKQSIIVEYYHRQEKIYFYRTLKDYENDDILDSVQYETYSDVNCSCGITEVEGINYLYTTLTEIVTKDVIGKIFSYMFNEIKKQEKSAFILVSTIDSRQDVCQMLDKIKGGTKTPFRTNPNTKNTIKAWLI